MIEKIRIQNFRTHAKNTIDFDKGVTTIIGSSFAGKSTIIKALKWNIRNKPAGDSVIKWGTDKTVVRVSFDNEKSVTRIRGKSANTYKLGKKEFTAFGNDVPKAIADLFNISDINFQGQFDSHFWFSETAGEVSRQLNKIVNLEMIDNTLSNIASQLRKTKIKIEIVGEDLENASTRKKELVYVKGLNADFIRVERLETEYNENALQSTTIAELLKSAISYSLDAENGLELVSDGKKAISMYDIYSEIKEKRENLQNLIVQAKKRKKEIQAKPPSITHLKKLKDEWEELVVDLEVLDDLIDELKDSQSQARNAQVKLVAAKKEFKKIIGKECPLCKRPMKR